VPVVPELVIAIAVVGAFIRWGGDASGPSEPPGPLQTQDNSGGVTISGVQLPKGQTGTIGVLVLVDPASLDQTLVLDGVGLIGATSGFRTEGAVVSTGAGGSYACVQSAVRFPPADCRIFPLEGWEVSSEALAHRGFQILLGVRATGDQPDTYVAVSVSYHSTEGSSYRLVLPQAGRVCLPRKEPGCGPGLGRLRNQVSDVSTQLLKGGSVPPPAKPGWPPLAETTP
jgi:hypothetical protein